MNACDRALAQKIFENSNIIKKNNLNIIVKDIPDLDKKGVFDPREFFIRNAIAQFAKRMPPAIDVDTIRKTTRTYCVNINEKQINQSEIFVDVGGRQVKVYVYEPRERVPNACPAFIYIHGGSFMSSAAEYYKDPCMFIAEKASCVVFNIEYSLAPENMYPVAINECEKLVEYINDNCDKYNIDINRIAIGGDSAGANLAIVTALNCPDKIKPSYLALLYPCVDLCGKDGLYSWDESDYEIDDSQRELIVSRLSLGRTDGNGNDQLMEMIVKGYLGKEYEQLQRNPQASPIYADVSALPRTQIFTAEFDGLRPQGEYFAKKLQENNVDNQIFRYRGVSHAFLDYFGILPQAEAALLEIVEQLKK